MIHVSDRRCRKTGRREDGERSSFVGNHEFSVTKMTILTGCQEILTGGHVGLEGVLLTGFRWGGNPIVARCNGER